jgi:hypothetical protein
MLEHGGADGDQDDGRCAECERAAPAGPCAACEAMICPDCGVMSPDPVAARVICRSCARLIADVGARPARRRGAGAQLLAVAVLVAFGLAALTLL